MTIIAPQSMSSHLRGERWEQLTRWPSEGQRDDLPRLSRTQLPTVAGYALTPLNELVTFRESESILSNAVRAHLFAPHLEARTSVSKAGFRICPAPRPFVPAAPIRTGEASEASSDALIMICKRMQCLVQMPDRTPPCLFNL